MKCESSHNDLLMKKIPQIIKTVLGGLTQYNVTNMRLPSAGTRSKFLNEALVIGNMQVAESMLESGVDGNFGNCLHGDGTTKYSKHYQNFQVTTASGTTLSFGLSEVVDSDASAVLKNFVLTIDTSRIISGSLAQHNKAMELFPLDVGGGPSNTGNFSSKHIKFAKLCDI